MRERAVRHRLEPSERAGEQMLDFGFYNMDCMEGMKEFPDNYFDLAIVDPPYGINITGRHKAPVLAKGDADRSVVHGGYGKGRPQMRGGVSEYRGTPSPQSAVKILSCLRRPSATGRRLFQKTGARKQASDYLGRKLPVRLSREHKLHDCLG